MLTPRLLWLVLLLASAAQAEAAPGQAVAVLQRSVITADGQQRTLSTGDPVSEGDMIQTSRSGEAQLLFPDGTRIVVGPLSALRIDHALFRSGGQARRLGVAALGGSFRFISGVSKSRAYSIRTPTATLGVRGTAFDVSVPSAEITDLAVFDGSVRFCGRGLPCISVGDGCHIVRVDGSRYRQPETREQLNALVGGSFPYIGRQQGLRSDFRVSTDGCDSVQPIRLPRPARQRNGDAGQDRSEPDRSEPGGSGNPAE